MSEAGGGTDKDFEATVRLVAEQVFGKRFSLIKTGGSGSIETFEMRVTVPDNDPGGWKSGKGKRLQKSKSRDL